jgi:hypothetical protein
VESVFVLPNGELIKIPFEDDFGFNLFPPVFSYDPFVFNNDHPLGRVQNPFETLGSTTRPA